MMEFVVLGMLVAVGPQSVYSANKFFEAGISLFYAASLGSIRQAFQRLLRDGRITVSEDTSSGRTKKLYAATPKGRRAFEAWLVAPIDGRDLRVEALSRLYFLGSTPAPATRKRVLDNIAERAAADEARLIALAEMIDGIVDRGEVPEQYRELARYQRFTVEYGVQSTAFGREFFSKLAEREASDEQ